MAGEEQTIKCQCGRLAQWDIRYLEGDFAAKLCANCLMAAACQHMARSLTGLLNEQHAIEPIECSRSKCTAQAFAYRPMSNDRLDFACRKHARGTGWVYR